MATKTKVLKKAAPQAQVQSQLLNTFTGLANSRSTIKPPVDGHKKQGVKKDRHVRRTSITTTECLY